MKQLQFVTQKVNVPSAPNFTHLIRVIS